MAELYFDDLYIQDCKHKINYMKVFNNEIQDFPSDSLSNEDVVIFKNCTYESHLKTESNHYYYERIIGIGIENTFIKKFIKPLLLENQ